MLSNITIEEAKRILSFQKTKLSVEKVHILDALNYVLAENIFSGMNIPPFDRSPLDGYAYKSEDTKNATKENPMTLEVIDHINAGYVSNKVVNEGQAIRIMTGAKIPDGANVIIRYEDTEFDNKKVKIFTHLEENKNIIKMGEDLLKGQLALSKGTIIGPAEVGILSTLGKEYIEIFSRPKIAILSTGDELVDIDEEITEGKIRNSNSYMIASQVKMLGIEPKILGSCRDEIDECLNLLKDALEDSDIIITTGGASVGDADIIKEVFKGLGAEILFWRVKVKPGTPIVVAKINNKFLFGLSGNPAAAFITFEQFVRPMIIKMMGKDNINLMKIDSTLESEFTKVSGQNRYVRAFTYIKNGQYYTKLPDKHSSSVLSSMSGMNSIFLVPAGSEPYTKGTRIKVELLNYIEVEK